MSRQTTYGVFLRGINLGKARRIAMAKLRDVLTSAGYDGVRTVLASGNVVLTSARDEQTLVEHVEQAINAAFDAHIPVIVRSEADLAALFELNPLRSAVTNPSRYLVTMCDHDATAVALRGSLESAALSSSDDLFVQHGRDLFSWYPEGVARSTLATTIAKHCARDPRLHVTGRNWNTIEKILAACRTSSSALGTPSSTPGAPSSTPGAPSSAPGTPSSTPGAPSSTPGAPSSAPGTASSTPDAPSP